MYIYIFKNISTGKKYLGFTTQNIETYLGSGKYWKNHCKSHGGLNELNIEKVWYQWFETKDEALKFIKEIESENPNYWETDEWANLVPETLDKSPFKDNMNIIFERNGNPFKGGEIQRQAWADGKYDKRDHSEAARKSWINRDKKQAVSKMQDGHKKWREENKEYYLSEQNRKLDLAREARRLTLQKFQYKGKIYYGWSELMKATNKSKWFLKKDPEVIKL